MKLLREKNVAFVALIGVAVWGYAQGAAGAHVHHEGSYDGPWWLMWNLRPSVLIVLALFVVLYMNGVSRLWQRAGCGRGISVRQAWIFNAGIAVIAMALVSPIDIIAEQLNSVHMVQHMLLIKIAAPLLVLGSAGQAMLWSLPRAGRVRIASSMRVVRNFGIKRYILWQPLMIWACFALVLWLLHIPELYHAALRNRFLHDLQHVAFVASACLFWRVLLDPISSLRISPGLGVMYLFTTMLHASALGVFMAFSPGLWYSDYMATTEQWNVQPLIDQQIAGYIMWMPACMVYAAAAAVIFGLWLQEPIDDPSGTREGRLTK